MNQLTLAIVLFTISESLIWLQTNGQFLWKWFEKNPIIISISLGSIISYMFIFATKNVVEHFNGLLWPGRFIVFGVGMISFTFLTWIFMGESITPKTAISLLLATALVCIQILWKV
jgi:hypothetical protein